MRYITLILLLALFACRSGPKSVIPVTAGQSPVPVRIDSARKPPVVDTFHTELPGINTGTVKPDSLVAFAKTLIGTPYVYASTDPAVGFDCSGFITYVFNHFHIAVPRSSVDFTNIGQTVSVAEAKQGDLILFTGTRPEELGVGHMGLVIANDTSGLQFIHATSGKAMAVTITSLNEQYRKRFVRISRIFRAKV